MEDNQNLELETANLDNEEAEQPANPDNGNAKTVEQEEKPDLSKFTKAEPKVDAKAEARKKAKDGIINSFIQKVATGEIEIEEVPEWARGKVSNQLGEITKPQETTQSFNKDDIVKQAKEELKFESKLDSLSKNYNQEEINLIQSQFQLLKEDNPAIKGSEAIDYAIFKLGFANKEDRQKQRTIKNAGLPPHGNAPKQQGVYTEEQAANMSQSDFEKFRKRQLSGEITIK